MLLVLALIITVTGMHCSDKEIQLSTLLLETKKKKDKILCEPWLSYLLHSNTTLFQQHFFRQIEQLHKVVASHSNNSCI